KFERMKKLKESGSIDEQSFEDIQSAFLVAQSAYQFTLENTEIRSPIDGTVTLVAQKEGENFNSMFTPVLIRIVNTEKMTANIQISDKDVALVKEGQKVEVRVKSEPDEIFMGKIYFISPEADQFGGTFHCKLSVQNRKNILKHNQFADFRIILKTKQNALTVPQKAIIDKKFVLVAENGTAKKKMIKIGIENEFKAEIISGLQENEKVLVEGIVGLKDGNKIEITE
ncbi:MAG: efflux RND transporter periplasmic adaptor subunit, partial [Candidatus Cloacimonadota bacterium]